MKKKLIIFSVAAALAPAAAMAATKTINITSDITIYGRVHLSVDGVSGIAANTNQTSLNSNSSRFGVKGEKDLGVGGLKGMFQLESGVNAVGGTDPDGNGGATATANGHVFSNARDMYVGLSGGFGTLKAGRMGGANQWVYDSNLFADQLGDAGNFNSGRGVGGRLSGIMAYETPDMSGFKAGLTYIPAASLDAGATTGKSSYGAKLDYANMGFGGHLAHFKVSTTTAAIVTDNMNTSVAGSYDFGNGMVTAQYVKSKVDVTAAASTTQNIYNIGAKFNVSSNGAIKAQYSRAGNLTGTANSGANMFAIGYDHKLSDAMDMYVVYAKTTNEANARFAVDNYGHGGKAGGLAVAGEDPAGFGIGLTYNF
ncbi:MAG: porin [Nitrosomonadales bacterium]|nr:porin [Nitrosomonadales bacterium]